MDKAETIKLLETVIKSIERQETVDFFAVVVERKDAKSSLTIVDWTSSTLMRRFVDAVTEQRNRIFMRGPGG